MSLKDDLLTLDDRDIVKEYVPEWKREVYLSTMSAGAFMDWAAMSFDEKGRPRRGEQKQAAFLVACCLVDENGERVFNPVTDADIELLLKKNYRVITRLSERCMRLNFMDAPAIEKAEQVF